MKKNGSFGFAAGSALCVGAKANVPFVRLAKIELKKSAVGKNKKYIRVGKEGRLTRCPVAMWSIWLSPVKLLKHFCQITCVIVHEALSFYNWA